MATNRHLSQWLFYARYSARRFAVPVHYGGIVWAALRLAAPYRGILTPCNPVAHDVRIIGGGYYFKIWSNRNEYRKKSRSD